MNRLPRWATTSLAAGLIVVAVLLVGRSLWYELGTGAIARAEQSSLRDRWEATTPNVSGPAVGVGTRTVDEPRRPRPATLEGDGSPVAAVSFHRPGYGPLVSDLPYIAVSGAAPQQLRGGVGHYPSSAQPGELGNFALAGHRNTHARPFAHIDQLRAGDEVHVQDRDGHRWVYTVTASIVTAPDDVAVVSSDPLGVGKPTITLTTCHPRGSAQQRLVVFGILRDSLST